MKLNKKRFATILMPRCTHDPQPLFKDVHGIHSGQFCQYTFQY